MENNYSVYQHITPDNMYYFGQTQNVKKRWSNNGSLYKGTALQPYIEKFGWENIQHIVLFKDQTRENALSIEDSLIISGWEKGNCINQQRSGLISKEDGYKQEYDKQYYEQNKDKKQQYYEQNKDKRLEYQQEYYEQNKEQIREYQQEYYEQNKEQIREQKQQYREQNKDKIREYQQQYYEQNKDKFKEYYEQNKEQIREQKQQYYEQNKDKIKQYREQNKDKIREYQRQYYQRKKKEKQFRELGDIPLF